MLGYICHSVWITQIWLIGGQAQPPSETRNAEDIGASSRMSSKEDVEKLIVDVEQKCRPITETVKTATDEVDRTKPSVDMRQKDTETPTSETTDKTAADEDATGSSLEKTDEIVTNDRVEPQQQEQQQVTRYDEEMKTDGKNEDTEDDEITFKKSAKHATQQQIDVDCKQESTWTDWQT